MGYLLILVTVLIIGQIRILCLVPDISQVRFRYLPVAGCGPPGPDVRFGSKADMCSAQGNVRFVPIADIRGRG